MAGKDPKAGWTVEAKALSWVWDQAAAHRRATFRILAALGLLAGVWWVVVFPGAAGMLVIAAAAATLWATFQFARSDDTRQALAPVPVIATVDPLRVTFTPSRPMAAFAPPVEGMRAIEVGVTLATKPRVDDDGDDEAQGELQFLDEGALRPWTLPIWTPGYGCTDLLVAGAKGSGKTRFYWAVVDGLREWVKSGHVQLWGLDPKRVGLGIGRPMFKKLWTPRGEVPKKWGEGAADLLEEAVDVMESRLDSMDQRGVTEHTPTPEEPLILIVLDEIARMRLAREKAIRDRIEDSIMTIIEEGRAPCLSMLIATQDPRERALGQMRELIPQRVAFRLLHRNQCDMVLGEGARESGAKADLIPRNQPGMAYMVVDDDESKPQRVKSHFLTNDEIARMVELYAPPRSA